MTPQPRSSARRDAIADAAVQIISRRGVRALTHRAVDAEAGLPAGSTSSHARTRAALLELVVGTLSDRTDAQARATPDRLDGDRVDVDTVASVLTDLVDSLAARRDDMRARYALILELDSPELRASLTTGSEVYRTSRAATFDLFSAAGIDATDERVDGLLSLADSLVFQRAVMNDGLDAAPVFAAYLRGLATLPPD